MGVISNFKVPKSTQQTALKPKFFEPVPDKVRARDILRELPGAAVKVGKSILQSIGTSFLGAGKAITTGRFDEPFRPETKLEQAITGRTEPFSIKSVGEETLKGFGAKPSTAAKFGLPLGLVLAGLDIFPLPGGKVNLLKDLAKLDDVTKIIPILKGVNVSDDIVVRVAENIAKVKTAKEVESILKKAEEFQKITHTVKNVPTSVKTILPTSRTAPVAGRLVGTTKQLLGKTGEEELPPFVKFKNLNQAMAKFDSTGSAVLAERPGARMVIKAEGDFVKVGIDPGQGKLVSTDVKLPEKIFATREEAFDFVRQLQSGIKISVSKPETFKVFRAFGDNKKGIFYSTEFMPEHGVNKLRTTITLKRPYKTRGTLYAVRDLLGEEKFEQILKEATGKGIDFRSRDLEKLWANQDFLDWIGKYEKELFSKAKSMGYDGIVIDDGTIVDLKNFDSSKFMGYKARPLPKDYFSPSSRWEEYPFGDTGTEYYLDDWIVGQPQDSKKFVAINEKLDTLKYFNSVKDAQKYVESQIISPSEKIIQAIKPEARPSILGKQEQNIAARAFDLTKKNGGVTISLKGEIPTDGFSTATSKLTEKVIPQADFTVEDIAQYMQNNMDALKGNDVYIGGYIDPADGKVYLDLPTVFDNPVDASKAAKLADQNSIFDIKNGNVIERAEYEKIIVSNETQPRGIREGVRQEGLADLQGQRVIERAEQIGSTEAGRAGQAVEPPRPPVETPSPEQFGRFKERGFVTSVKESPAIHPDVKALLEDRSYPVITNVESLNKAQQLIETNKQTARDLVMNPKSKMDADYSAAALLLIKKANDTRNFDEAMKLIDAVAENGTSSGQGIQILSALNRFTPEGIVFYAKKVFKKASKPGDAARVETVTKTLVKKLKETQTEAADQMAKEANQIFKGIAKGVIEKDPAKRLAKRISITSKVRKPDPVKDMVDTLYKVAQETLPARNKPVPRSQIELIGSAIRDKVTYKDVWERAQDLVKAKYADNEDALDLLDRYFNQILERPFAKKQVTSAVGRAIREEEIDLGKLVRQHYTSVDATKESLIQKLIDEADIPVEEAGRLASEIETRFNQLVKDRKDSILKTIFRERSPDQVQKNLSERIIEMSNLGAFEDPKFKPLIAKKLGVPTMTNELAQQLTLMAEKIQRMPWGYEKILATQDMMALIDDQLPSTWGTWIKQITNFPRAILASFDLSFGFRQGLFMAASHPIIFATAWKRQFKVFWNEQNYINLMDAIVKDPQYGQSIEFGMPYTDLAQQMARREEPYMASWAEKIPLIGKKWFDIPAAIYSKTVGRVVKASSRAFTGMGNQMRLDLWKSLTHDAERLALDLNNINPRTGKKLGEEIAHLIAAGTGRGGLGRFERAAIGLSTIFFSPRLIASRLTLLNPIYYIKADPFVRKEALKSLFALLGAGMTVLGIAKMAGAEVGTDSNSSDFGKIKIGNTRIDIWGGFQPYVRSASQLISKKYVSSATGKEITLGEGYKALTRQDIALRIIESKLSPAASFVNDFLRQKDYAGEPVTITKEVKELFTPLVLQDMMDLVKDDPGLIPLSGLPFFGFGVQTYGKPSGTGKIGGSISDFGNLGKKKAAPSFKKGRFKR